MKLVATNDTIAQCMQLISEQCFVATGDTQRKPPVCLSRLARGGKTTILRLLFEQLKTNGFMPVYVNFNGGFRQFPGESQADAILRVIAVQLIDESHKGSRIQCSKDELEKYIQSAVTTTGRPFILLIDELNSLSYPPDQDAAQLLREMFLDPKNRYLVFSTHRPVYIDGRPTPVSALMGSPQPKPSDRGVNFVRMPESWNLRELQAISMKCSGITKAEIALYGGIPSLLYCTKVVSTGSAGLRIKFDGFAKCWSTENDPMLLTNFVKTVIYGKPLFGVDKV